MKWPGWYNVSVRKPLAALSTLWGMLLCTIAFVTGHDIPPGVQSVMIAIIPACVASYAASSAYETVRTPQNEEEKKINE